MRPKVAVGLLAPAEAAERLGISRAAYRTMAEAGEIPGAFRPSPTAKRGVAAAFYISREDLEKYLAEVGEQAPANGDHPAEAEITPEPEAAPEPAATDAVILTAQQAADRLGMHRTTLTHLMKVGRVPGAFRSTAPGQRGPAGWMMPEADLEAFAATPRPGRGQRRGPSAPNGTSAAAPAAGARPPAGPAPAAEDPITIALRIRADADLLLRALRRQADQQARVAGELVKLMDPGAAGGR